MAQQPKEQTIVRAAVDAVEAAGGVAIKYSAAPYGKAGTPDVLGVLAGRALAWECKRPGGKPTALQAEQMRRWAAAGADVRLIRSKDEAAAAAALVAGGGGG